MNSAVQGGDETERVLECPWHMQEHHSGIKKLIDLENTLVYYHTVTGQQPLVDQT